MTLARGSSNQDPAELGDVLMRHPDRSILVDQTINFLLIFASTASNFSAVSTQEEL